MIMRFINPTFHNDMMRVFQTERSPSDSQRFISKLKSCEDTDIKSPVSSKSVYEELNYELAKMKQFKRMLVTKKTFSYYKDKLKLKLYKNNKKAKNSIDPGTIKKVDQFDNTSNKDSKVANTIKDAQENTQKKTISIKKTKLH